MFKRRYNHSFVLFLSFFLFFFMVSEQSNAQADSEQTEKQFPALKPAGFLQQLFITDQTPDSPPRFRIHRARLGFAGAITDRISVNLIGGFAEPPDNTPRLVNAFIDFDIHRLLQVRTGQFLLPFGLEGPQPIFLNPAIERSTAIRRLNPFAMFRDVGLRLSGGQSSFKYAVAIVNGEGANQLEQFDPKDVMGRIALSPVDMLEIGVSGHLGQYRPVLSTDDHESRFRTGVDISYDGKSVFARAEYQVRQDDLPAGGSQDTKGAYLLGGYKFTENLETIARYEYYEPDTPQDDYLTGLLIGANYYFIGNTRLSLNYEFREDRLNPELGNLLTLQMQVTL